MKLKNLFAATVLAAATTLSFASSPVTLAPLGPNAFGTVLIQTSPAEVFVDSFDFAALSSTADVVFTLFNVSRPAQFFVADIAATGGSGIASFSFFPKDGPLSPVSFHTSIAANTPFTLTVFGSGVPVGDAPFATGSLTYGVAVVATVPEPETYALMLLGLIGVGGMARRQQRVASSSTS